MLVTPRHMAIVVIQNFSSVIAMLEKNNRSIKSNSKMLPDSHSLHLERRELGFREGSFSPKHSSFPPTRRGYEILKRLFIPTPHN